MFEKYLEETRYVDYSSPNVRKLAKLLKDESEDEISLIKDTYHYVRDKTHHLGRYKIKELQFQQVMY